MAKGTKIKTPIIARVNCPLCLTPHGAIVRLTKKRHSPYLRCPKCKMQVLDRHAVVHYLLNLSSSRILLEAWSRVRWGARLRVEEQQQAERKQVFLEHKPTQTPTKTTEVLALVPCPMCKEKNCKLKLTKKHHAPYLRCYDCMAHIQGTAGVTYYLLNLRRALLQPVDFERREILELLEDVKERKEEKKKWPFSIVRSI